MKQVKFAELFQPLFLNGKNFGLKLFNKDDLTLQYDEEGDWLLATYKGKTARLRYGVHSHELMTETDLVLVPTPPPAPVPAKKVKAQVSGPTDHVFQGEGHGVSRDKR